MSYHKSRQKKQRLKFDHLSGDTSWERLMTWIRRRRLRIFSIYTGIIVVLFSLIGYSVYVDITEGEPLGDVLPVFLILLAVYSIPCIWMLVWIFMPEKHRQIRRIKRLGDVIQLAQKLEVDLASPDNILYQKGGVLVTQRFIVDTSYGTFSLYPLEGLVSYDITPAPIFYYEDGKVLAVRTAVSFKKLIPYLQAENRSAVPANRRSRPKQLISFMLTLYILIIFAMTIIFEDFLEGSLKYVSIFSKGVGFLFLGVIGLAVLFVLLKAILKLVPNLKQRRQLNNMNVEERIRHMEELISKEPKRHPNQLNTLSTLYFEHEDVEKALSLVREALSIAHNTDAPAPGTKTVRLGGQTGLTNVCQLNEAHYLIELNRFDEAEQILNTLDESSIKNSFLPLYKAHCARIALCRQEAAVVRTLLRQARALKLGYFKQQRVNLEFFLLMIDAECDLLEYDPSAAISKLHDVITSCTYAPTVSKAEKLKNRIETEMK